MAQRRAHSGPIFDKIKIDVHMKCYRPVLRRVLWNSKIKQYVCIPIQAWGAAVAQR
jgi:hypothetical protein